MNIFDADYLNKLIAEAKSNPRKRQHYNIHQSYTDPCQRLFNAIEPGSYIRPHRHADEPRNELLVAICGSMVLVTFDEYGTVAKVIHFGSDRNLRDMAIAVEIPSNTWHTVIALESGCVLLEIKAGPFDPKRPKNMAPWAPDEGTIAANDYLNKLIERVAE